MTTATTILAASRQCAESAELSARSMLDLRGEKEDQLVGHLRFLPSANHRATEPPEIDGKHLNGRATRSDAE